MDKKYNEKMKIKKHVIYKRKKKNCEEFSRIKLDKKKNLTNYRLSQVQVFLKFYSFQNIRIWIEPKIFGHSVTF